ncbi:hypothetical protein FQA39_LY15894 [Lamprigera yunnana]|nr:hypothetical protein FQA39_LY15894 [Lamprigera yunnana]
MARCPELPFLPGYTFNPLIGKTNFRLNPKFGFIAKGVSTLVEDTQPNTSKGLNKGHSLIYPRSDMPDVPSWITFDRQILRFYAIFKQTLQEVKRSPCLIRKVLILFFLEDGTIQVIEPKIDNSGVSQGILVARGKIRFPAPMDTSFYDIIDFNIGKEVEFYGIAYKILDCDKFTRSLLNRCGIPVPDPINSPVDSYSQEREVMREVQTKRPSHSVYPVAQFLKNDQKVLRFYAYWDDRETLYGYLHHLEVQYYLADDTVDIKEVIIDNGGNKSTFTFLKRSKLVKAYKSLPGIGANAHDTLLNVLGNDVKSGRFIKDVLGWYTKEKVQYYKEQDLAIGGVLNCFGRKVILTNCDSFTKEYYHVKYGIDNFVPIPKPEEQTITLEEKKEIELPPWNGHGSFEDSAQNCRKLVIKPPQGEFKKFLENDKVGLDSHILRFEAKMISKNKDNCGRIFVISYFLNNDNILVFEIARDNSGFNTSKFFKKSEVKLPDQPLFSSKPPDCYRSQHMFVGATLNINNFEFVLVDADDYALRYMELNSHQFPKSNIQLIMDKVRNVLRPIYKDFVAENVPTDMAIISYEKLREKLCRIMGNDFTEQEMITISRAYSANCVKDRFKREVIRAITLTELKRYLWDDHKRTKEYFLKFDPERVGILTRKEVYTLLKACKLPLDIILINRILNVIKTDKDGNIVYEDLLKFLDSDVCPMGDVIPINIKYDLCWTSEKDHKAGKLIDWCAFNKALDLEQQIINAAGEMLNKLLY